MTRIETAQQMASVRFSPCGKVLAAAGRDGLVHRWDLAAFDFTPPPPPPTVPEPGTIVLIASGAAAILARFRRGTRS